MSERKNCLTCDKQLGRYNRSGYCTRHVSAAVATDPQWREKQRSGAIRALQENPDRLTRLRERARIHGQLPQAIEGRRRHAIESRIWERGHATIAADPEIRARAGRRQSATKLGWCPNDLRGAYRQLVHSKKVPAAEARRMILEQHERRMVAFRNRMEAASL